jgi:pyridoxal biosynthesis lyase PdxS
MVELFVAAPDGTVWAICSGGRLLRADGGVARMASPRVIKEIQDAVTIPVMAKARIGHFVEAQILEALEVDYIDESEVLTPADEDHHIDKWKFTVPFVCDPFFGAALRVARRRLRSAADKTGSS